MALQGTLDTFALPDVLRLLAATRKTGRLRITGGRGTGNVWVAAGEVSALEATHAPHATEPVDALFELLRFADGSFTFDSEVTHDEPGHALEVDTLVGQSEALLTEWRAIEAVVPSLDAWVTLRKSLPEPEITVDQDRWTTIGAVGGGATVRRIGDELCLAELPVSRAVKDLVEAGLVEVVPAAPSGAASMLNSASAPAVRPLGAPAPLSAFGEPHLAVVPPPAPSDTPDPDEQIAPGNAFAGADVGEQATPASAVAGDLAAAFPGLANRATVEPPGAEAEEIARQLATLSPRAANAIRAAAEATTDEEREAALDAAEGEDQPLNRGLLLKFLSSVKT